MQLIDRVVQFHAEIQQIRRDIHAHPELCFEETAPATSSRKSSPTWGIEVHRGLGKHRRRRHPEERQVKARRRPARRHGRAADPGEQQLRAPLDARRQDARVRPRRPHRDAAGGGKHLAESQSFDGTVYLIFQPAEEGGAGAHG